MPMRVLSPDECDARTGTVESTRRVWVKQGRFPAPIPLGEGGRLKGYLESEIEEWIKLRIAARDSFERKHSSGRAQFWADVRDGKRPHPRTVGRLKREAAELAAAERARFTSQWVVITNGAGGAVSERFAADRADAQRILEDLRRESPSAGAWMCERVTRHDLPAKESDDAGAS
jgi:predicted DNA-binding transcriptional regulator AlpA